EGNPPSLFELLPLLVFHDRIQQALHVIVSKRPHFYPAQVAAQLDHRWLANLQLHDHCPELLHHSEQLVDLGFLKRVRRHRTSSIGSYQHQASARDSFSSAAVCTGDKRHSRSSHSARLSRSGLTSSSIWRTNSSSVP